MSREKREKLARLQPILPWDMLDYAHRDSQPSGAILMPPTPPTFGRRLAWVTLAGAAVAVISAMWLVALYQFPIADDFCRIVAVRSASGSIWFRTFSLTVATYLTWSGRWTTLLVHFLVLGSIDTLKNYPVTILVLAALQLLAIVVCFRYVLELSGSSSWLAGTIFYAVLITTMRNIAHNLYWFTGAVEYQFTFTTALALFTWVRLAPDKPLSNSLLCLATIAVCGQHELAAVSVLGIFACVWAVQRYTRQDSLRFFLFTAAAAAGLALTVLARGNFVRAGGTHAGFAGAIIAGNELGKLLRYSASDPKVLLSAFLWIQFVLHFRRKTMIDVSPVYQRLAPLLTIVLFLIIVAVPPVSTGLRVDRASGLALTVLLWGTTISIFLLRSRLAACAAPGLRTVAAVALACALISSPNVQQAQAALRVSPRVWRQRMVARLSAKGPNVLLPPVEPPSTLLVVPGVWAAEPGSWLNVCVADFMNVRSVVPAVAGPCAAGCAVTAPRGLPCK